MQKQFRQLGKGSIVAVAETSTGESPAATAEARAILRLIRAMGLKARVAFLTSPDTATDARGIVVDGQSKEQVLSLLISNIDLLSLFKIML